MDEKIKFNLKKDAALFLIAALVLSLAIVGKSAFLNDNSITGYAAAEGTLKEGDNVSKGEKFALNFGSPCEKVLVLKSIDVDNNSILVYITEENGESIPGFPASPDMNDKDSKGRYRLNISYLLYNQKDQKYNYSYTTRVDKDSKKLFLEDTTRECPPYCGNNVCESNEGYVEANYCRQDCMKKQGDKVYTNVSRERFFEINYGKECKGIYEFREYDGNNFDIREYVPNKPVRFPNIIANTTVINDYGFLVQIQQGSSHFVNARYNSTSGALYLEQTDIGCGGDCNSSGTKRCSTESDYQSCVKDPEGYLGWDKPVSCYPKVCSILANPTSPCVANCTQDCATNGEKRCSGTTTVETCGNFDTSDWCYEWGDPKECPEWNTCSNGTCKLSCTDECSVDNEIKCVNVSSTKQAVMQCGKIDEDPCFDLVEKESCLEGYTCSYNNTACQCKEKWTCTEWGECLDGKRSRTCKDDNSCPTTIEKANYPLEEACVVKALSLDCTKPAVFGPWGECQESRKRQRLVAYPADCNKTEEYEVENCVYTPPEPVQKDEETLKTEEDDGAANFVSPPPTPFQDEEEQTAATEAPAEKPIVFSFGTFAILFVIIVGGGAGFVYYEMSRSKFSLDLQKLGGMSNETKNQLHNYAKNMIANGYHADQIKQQLIKEGWAEKDLNKVMKDISEMETNQQVSNYVSQMRHAGYNDQQISAELSKQGWSQKQAAEIMQRK